MTACSSIWTSKLGCAAALVAFAVSAEVAPAWASAGAPAAGPPAVVAPSLDELAQARALASRGNLGDAIHVLEPYVAAHPLDLEAGRFLGDVRMRAADLAGAEQAYRTVLSIAPSDRETHDRLGNLYAREDRLDDAIVQYEKTLPDTVAYIDLIRVHKRRGDLANFVESFRHEADENPWDGSAQYSYGLVLLDLAKPGRAYPYLETAVNLAPQSCAALTALGDALVDLKHPSTGIGLIERCLKIDPSDYSALIDLACAQISRDDVSALKDLNRAITLYPNRPEAYVDLGYLDDTKGQPEAASEQYTYALALDPFARNAYVDLGYNQLESGRFADAEATLLHGLSASNDDGRLEFILAETFERLGKRDLARREYQSATRSDEPEIAQAAARRLSVLFP